MQLKDIALRRLAAQHLVGNLLATPEDVVRHFMCVQAQDYYGAKWTLGQRARGAKDAAIDAIYDDGKILRTHMLRPTWHFVLPEDIRWILHLTSARVHQISAYYYRKLGLDEQTFTKSERVLLLALRDNTHLTRTELKAKLEAAGINAEGLRLAYIIMHAELDGIICSGVRHGKQHTYALMDERVPGKGRELAGDEALGEFVLRYFRAHGPAQVQDLMWWSSLKAADIKRGIEVAGSALKHEEVGGKTYWFTPSGVSHVPAPAIHLLSNYDELTVAYKDHSASFDQARVSGATLKEREFTFYNHVIMVNGLAIAGWSVNKNQLQLRLLSPLSAAERAGVQAAAKRFGDFLGKSLTVA